MENNSCGLAMKTVMGTKWVEEQNKRMLRMERLYVLDGRHRPEHEFHGLYTGLAERAEEIEENDPACYE
tara:strand:- start:340 stop:546 length:207 start_codon:yes stop_codon:yes gene_type:complete